MRGKFNVNRDNDQTGSKNVAQSRNIQILNIDMKNNAKSIVNNNKFINSDKCT